MEMRQLGRNGPMVSAIGLGCWPIGGGMGPLPDEQAIAVVQRAIDLGITFIDTAESYLRSEELAGRAIRGRRERVFLVTKVSRRDLSPEHIRRACEQSLRHLGTEVIDLYLAHTWDPEHPIEEAMETFDQLVREGKVRYIGVSNFDVPQMRAAWAARPFQSLQPRYNMLQREPEAEILPYCLSQGIGVVVHSPLAKGLLTGKYRPEHQFPPEDERSERPLFQGEAFARNLALAEKLKPIAEGKGLSLPQLAIGWTLAHPAVTVCIVGAKTVEQVEQNVGGQGWALSADEQAKIEQVLAGS